MATKTSRSQTSRSTQKKITEMQLIDSAFFMTWSRLRHVFYEGIKAVCDLSVTQYRILIYLTSSKKNGVGISEGCSALALSPSLASQSIDVLETMGYAERIDGPQTDKRARNVRLTAKGYECLNATEEALVKKMEEVFSGRSTVYQSFLDIMNQKSAIIDQGDAQKYPISCLLSLFERLATTAERALKKKFGLNLVAYRVMQTLTAEDMPLRMGDISYRTETSPVAVTRAAATLLDCGCAQKYANLSDAKAIYLALTKNSQPVNQEASMVMAALIKELVMPYVPATQLKAMLKVGTVIQQDLAKSRTPVAALEVEQLVPVEE